MLPTWENRPEITANLNNPAFCCELMRVCAKAFALEASANMPFSLSIFTLPLILPRKNRVTLPKGKATRFHKWINDNEDLKVRFGEHVKAFIPFTKETVMFGMVHGAFRIDAAGSIEVLNSKSPYTSDDPEVKECISKATVVGKMLALAGTSETIYSLFGLKP
jgi:hypothetical protein